MFYRAAVVLLCGAFALSGCAAIEDFLDGLPAPASGSPDEVVLEGEWKAGEVREPVLVHLRGGNRIRLEASALSDDVGGGGVIQLYEADPADPLNRDKWQFRDAVMVSPRGDISSRFIGRARHGQYALNVDVRGPWRLVARTYDPTTLPGLEVRGPAADGSRSLRAEYFVRIPRGDAFTARIETEPGPVMEVHIFEADPNDPTNSSLWKEVGTIRSYRLGPYDHSHARFDRSDHGLYVVQVEGAWDHPAYRVWFTPE
jgi:hypothetical protein